MKAHTGISACIKLHNSSEKGCHVPSFPVKLGNFEKDAAGENVLVTSCWVLATMAIY
jgi:hypothetical protein